GRLRSNRIETGRRGRPLDLCSSCRHPWQRPVHHAQPGRKTGGRRVRRPNGQGLEGEGMRGRGNALVLLVGISNLILIVANLPLMPSLEKGRVEGLVV